MTAGHPGRIVVGVDGSSYAASALDWAITEARVRGDAAVLDLVMAWHEPVAGGMLPVDVPLNLDYLQDSYRTELDQIVKPVRDENPDLDVRARLIRGSAARVLLDEAVGADLLVVGSRGRGGFLGLLLGSVSHHVVNHSTCPVVVVPHRSPHPPHGEDSDV